MHTIDSLSERLRDVQAAKTEAREERAACARALEQARAALSRVKVSPNALVRTREWRAAEQARDALEEADSKLSDLTDAEHGLLRQLGQSGHNRGASDCNGPRSHEGPTGSGWEYAARELDLQGGRHRIDLPARDLLAAVDVTPSEGLTAPAVVAPFAAKAQDRRFIYPFLRQEAVEGGDLAVSDYKQVGSREVEGSVTRDPASTTEKAKLSLSLELETPSLKQHAAVIENVPSKLFDAVPVLQAWLESELRYQLDLAVDAHVLSQIEAAAPPTGEEGESLIEKLRHGVSAMRGVGGNAGLAALSPSDAAALDLSTTGTQKVLVFPTRTTGTSSPIWDLVVVESPTVTEPVLIDPALLGILYSATGTVLIDPFTGMSQNLVRVRCEVDALFHVRDVSGVYVIAKGE